MLAAHRVLHAPLASASYDATILADGPIAFWPLNESSGTTAHDQTGNGYNGTYMGGYTLGQTGIGDGETAVAFNGSTGTVDCTAATAVSSLTTFSAECWIYTSSSSFGPVIDTRPNESDPGYGWELDINWPNNPGVGVTIVASGGGGGSMGSSSLPSNTWIYAVATYDGTTLRFYQDGSLVASNGYSYSAASNGLLIASRSTVTTGQNFCAATIAKVAVYSTVLTSTQISNHYAAA